jgi:hypothetical protein
LIAGTVAKPPGSFHSPTGSGPWRARPPPTLDCNTQIAAADGFISGLLLVVRAKSNSNGVTTLIESRDWIERVAMRDLSNK